MDARSSFLALFLLLSLSLSLVLGKTAEKDLVAAKTNPFTARAALTRYWDAHISNHLPKPAFFFSKASPLNAVDLAVFTKLASDEDALARIGIQSFCSSANLFCQSDVVSTAARAGSQGSDFAVYSNKQFVNYGSGKLGGSDSFNNYSNGLNLPTDSFARYSRDSTGHAGSFSSYARDANVANGTFASYGAGATGGSGGFDSYDTLVNVPHLHFASYDQSANNHKLSFSSYTAETNSGDESFSSYGRAGNGAPAEFKSYADQANTVGSTFTGYGESGNGANDTFRGYGGNGNNPHNNFKSYGNGGNAGVDSFASYRDGANVGDDTFQTYAKNSNSAKVSFGNYGKTFNEGTDLFKEYGKGSKNPAVGFKEYGLNTTFRSYADKGINFAMYTKPGAVENRASEKQSTGQNRAGKSWVEPGKFFREAELKQGTVMMMPDIRDKMPQRSFLPRAIASKLPFSTNALPRLKRVFGATLERVMAGSISECERAPSRGETKRCVGSGEDMIDFATSVLGRSAVVRTTENVNGSKSKILVGKVVGINGGKVTKSVSCHRSLYPYLVYYCHSVPEVRVYEAELLEVETRQKMNRVVAICHVDTSAWSRTHGAFVALGSGPGEIEVCHWIFENDMTWSSADV
uniref:BURP domain-containing protein n=1 Tax=Kalanchoe fedtschenkoi TaxID=63787 RepID=A0A7N0TZY7_KALFE